MKKGKISKTILSTVFILLIIASIGFYVADIIINGTPPEENLFKMLVACFISMGGLCRLLIRGRRRKDLHFYESQYADQIKNAFADSRFYKNKLLCAIRLYNENNIRKAVKYLVSLKPVCKTRDDVYAVGLFLALSLTDMDYFTDAIEQYKELINMNVTSSTIYGNLGSLYSSIGNYDEAIANMRLSIQNDEKNPSPYNNLANLYFNNRDFEKAKEYAKKALEINHKFRQSAALLALVYSLENDSKNAEKYTHIAVSCGEDPKRIKNAVEHYKATLYDESDDEESSDDN